MSKRTHRDAAVGGRRWPWWAMLAAWVWRGCWRARWALLPFVVLAAVPVAGLALAVLYRLAGWEYVAGVYGVAVVIVAAWIGWGLSDGYDRALAGGTAALCGTYAGLLTADPFSPALWSLWPFAIVAAPLWWFGPTIKPRVQFDKVARRFARSKLAEDGGHLVGLARSAAGKVAHVRLGRRWQDGADREELADVLDVPDGSVIAEPDPRTRNRTVKATIIEGDTFGGPEIPHPALAGGATEAGGGWARDSRTITDPIPLGQRRDARPAHLVLYGDGGGRHGGVFGKTGSGKSGTVSAIVAGVAACRDARVIGSDAAKRGGTLKPWADVIAWAGPGPIDDDGPVPPLALTAADTARQLAALLVLAKQRGEAVADSDHDVHVPTADQPVYVYVIEELAALLNEKPEIDDQVVSLTLIGRQVGIDVLIVSQGGDWDSIPTKVRDNIMWRLLHRMEPQPFRLVARELVGRVDMTLFDVPGLVYVQDDGAEDDLMPCRVHALYRPADKRRLAGVYRREQTAGGARVAPTQRKVAAVTDKASAREAVDQAARDAAGQLAEPVDLARGPLGEVFAGVPAEVEPETAEDEAVTAAVVAVLRDAGDAGMSKSDIAARVESSPETVLRRLTALRASGRARTSGAGSRIRWHLTAVPVEA